MASSNECPDTTQVLLVDPQSLPVLLHGNSDINGSNISVDLLQQALQGTSAIDGDDGDPTEEVSLDVLGGNGDVLAIYQGEGGQTHTIKISLAEAQSLGLQLSDDNFPISLSDGSLANSLKVTAVGDQLVNNTNGALNDASLLQSVTCSDGRIIDEEGNIVEASEALQILPSSLSSFLDDGLNQSLSIVPQYELDGTVTYAVKLKDQNEAVLGPDYHVLEPDSSAKTGLDIEEELKNSSLKQNLLQTAETITAESLGLTATVALNDTSNSSSSTIQLPISTLEALSKQMLLPVSSSSVPISVTLTLPTETSVSTHQQSVSSNSVTNPNGGRYFQLVSDRCSVGLNNVISADAATVPLGTIVPQPTLTVNQQHPHLIAPSTTMLSVQSQPSVALLSNNRSINQTTSRHQIISEKLPPILAAPKLLPSPAIKTATAPKKLPISANVVSPAAVSSNIIHSPVMAAVPPTSQPNLGGAAISKSTGLSSGRLSHINSNSSKPLGSSENPIQLVQQGQTFHSMQALNQAQLRQIATVLQQKNLNSNSTATKNVLFDEQTKTRIVYRVVYPEDVDLQQPSSPSEKAGNFGSHSSKLVSRSRGRAGRPKMKRRSKKSDAEKYSKIESDPVLVSSSSHATDTKSGDLRDESILPEEPPKVEKKKILGSRTRSGRVSRPPRHMMKDFKHLHHTDYNKDKDGDDSDGYSDYSNPEQPPEKVCIKEVEDVSPVKRKVSRFSCPTCSKLYLGVGRMEKHFQQHPDHGSFEEFKKQLAACTPAEFNTPGVEARGERTPGGKANLAKGKKRNQSANQTDSSETRKKKLKQALQACEISEILEVAGPLIARYCTLWDLLLLRLVARDDSTVQRVNVKEEIEKTQSTTNLSEGTFNVQDLSSINETSSIFAVDCSTENSHHCRSTSNRVQWLLMELSSLAETLQSLSGDLFQPALIHCDDKVQIEINQKSVSELFGVSCGMYNVYEEQLSKRMQSLTRGSNERVNESLDAPPHKVSRKLDEAEDLALALNHGDSEVCSESLSSLSLMVKPVDTEKAILAKLTEDMPFLNSSDDMICGSDPDLSTDSKREQDCDSATGLQAVDDIVNERLKNLSENMNFAVPLQSDLESSDINADQSDLHLISSFGSANASISVSNPSVISSSLTENSKQSSSISNMDLMSSYSITSLSRPGAHDVNISNSEPSNELTSALEPVSSQTILGGFGIGLSALSSFDTLQSQSSNVPHSEDSFLESLGSFETPLTQAHLPQTCGSSNASGSSFDNGVMKSNSILQMTNEASESTRLPPKFISSFTPAVTSDKSTTSISTAQRLQRSYLELDDDGLDLDFDAFTQELSMNRNSSA